MPSSFLIPHNLYVLCSILGSVEIVKDKIKDKFIIPSIVHFGRCESLPLDFLFVCDGFLKRLLYAKCPLPPWTIRNGQVHVGYEALPYLHIDPENTIFNAKRFIGRSLEEKGKIWLQHSEIWWIYFHANSVLEFRINPGMTIIY